MEIRIDSFAAKPATNNGTASDNSEALAQLLERIEQADQVGLDIFGIGEHRRKEFLDAAPILILVAIGTKRIRLSSAVNVLRTADPVRVFQNFATLDLISKGRAERLVGRDFFTEVFPLFGLNFQDYDQLFSEKLDLLLNIRENKFITWSG